MSGKKDLNTVALVGRLTRDSQLKYTKGGTAVAEITIAVNSLRKQGSTWEEAASFFPVTLWGSMAENLSPHLRKGTQIAVQGDLFQQRWEYDGQKQSKVVIQAKDIELLSRPNAAAEAPAGYRGPSAPQTGYAQEPAVPQVPDQPRQEYVGPQFFDDDIPF